MKRKSVDEILSASKPSDIFTMNADTIEQEKDEYIERFKPKDYNLIKNFMATQKVILLYRQALIELEEDNEKETREYFFTIHSKDGKKYEVQAYSVYDIKIGKMYVTENNIVFIISNKNKKNYEIYIKENKKLLKIFK